MRRNLCRSIVLAAVFASGAAAAQEDAERRFRDFDFTIDWRVRYEGVDQAGIPEHANALTNRVRAGFESGPFAGTRLLAELVSVSDWVDDYNSTTNGKTSFPVVADPTGFTELNRLALINESLDNTRLTLGRQRLILDDARFVGNVGWRQNEQTFDGLNAVISQAGFSANLSYFNQVNRIFGPDSPAGEWNGDIVLLNASRTFKFGTLTAFAHGMEFEEAAAASNETLGIRLTGSRAFGDNAFIYTLSFAGQSDAGANPANYSEGYSKLEGGLTRGQFTVAVGREVLGGDGTSAFVTPLATLHAFQGWADKFLATPANGIEDSYIRFAYGRQLGSGPFRSLSFAGFYHEFDSDLGSASYGDEIDLSMTARTSRVAVTLKYSVYEAESLFTDTDKLWLSMDYAF